MLLIRKPKSRIEGIDELGKFMEENRDSIDIQKLYDLERIYNQIDDEVNEFEDELIDIEDREDKVEEIEEKVSMYQSLIEDIEMLLQEDNTSEEILKHIKWTLIK